MSSPMERESCSERIIADAGGAFGMGAVGGSAFHFIKGLRNAPCGARFAGGLEAVRMNAPRVAGSFAVWGGLYSICDCAFVHARQKEDPWNSILSGAATAGILSSRQGFGAVVRSSVQVAILLALGYGGFGAFMLHQCLQPDTTLMPANNPVITPVETSSDPGWFRGLFLKSDVEEGITNSNSKSL